MIEGDESDREVSYFSIYEEDPYFFSCTGQVEFVRFQVFLNSLAWLHRTSANAISDEDDRLAEVARSGAHRIPGWEGESDLVLNEVRGQLGLTIPSVVGGAIIVGCAAAFERLATELLEILYNDRGSRSWRRKGLQQKVQQLLVAVPALAEEPTFHDCIAWLRARRNLTAHHLVEGGPGLDADLPRVDIDQAEEALQRTGFAAWRLEEAWASRKGMVS